MPTPLGEATKLNRRDFVMFDTNGDGFLSLDEFSPITNGVEAGVRGPMPDPVEKLANQIAADLDKAFNDWNERPDEEFDSRDFVRKVSALFSNLIQPQAVIDADPDRSGKVSRAEARSFLEIQMGMRLPDGTPLRTPNGQVNNFSYFVHMDANRNNQIEKAEYIARSSQGNKAEANFVEFDKDGDGILSIAEWFAIPWSMSDPIWDFRHMDANRDGYLDTDELVKNSPAWKMPGTPHLVKIYDANNDGKMSLDEYRLSPHSNMISSSAQKPQQDLDNDGRLSIEEFAVDRPWFQIMRSIYFQKFDQNHDGYLDLKEYDFNTQADPTKAKKPREIYLLNADGTGLKKLNIGKVRGASVGSPSVSPNGKQIAFDVDTAGYTIMLMPIEGGEPKPLGHGTQPTWSPDGRKYACRRFTPQAGSWIIDLTRDDQKFLADGWGTQWSPDGKTIFWMSDFPGSTLVTYDVKSARNISRSEPA